MCVVICDYYATILANPIYNYNMCVRLSERPTTVPRFN